MLAAKDNIRGEFKLVELLVDYYKDEMVEDLARFIKIPSVKDAPEPNMPYGRGIFDALMYILNRADKMDFECVNLFGHMGYIDYGDGDEMLAILTHIDVVPAGEGWTKEAFGGEIDNGRGGMAGARSTTKALRSLRCMRSRRFPTIPSHSIRKYG